MLRECQRLENEYNEGQPFPLGTSTPWATRRPIAATTEAIDQTEGEEVMMMTEVTCERMDAQTRLDEASAHVQDGTAAFLAHDDDDGLIAAHACMDVTTVLEDAGATWPAADDIEWTAGTEQLNKAAAALDAIKPGRPARPARGGLGTAASRADADELLTGK